MVELVSKYIYIFTAGVIDRTLLKIKILNQHTIIEFEWQNEESKVKSNKGIYWQIERMKKNEIQLLFLLTIIFNIHLVNYVIRS
jgi:hypothetical protein